MTTRREIDYMFHFDAKKKKTEKKLLPPHQQEKKKGFNSLTNSSCILMRLIGIALLVVSVHVCMVDSH